jgi:hypothetical protein
MKKRHIKMPVVKPRYNAEVFPLVSWETVRAKLPPLKHSEMTAYFVVGVLVGDCGYNYMAEASLGR